MTAILHVADRLAERDRRITQRQRESARQAGCWCLLGHSYITSAHRPTDRCRKCGFDGRRIAKAETGA